MSLAIGIHAQSMTVVVVCLLDGQRTEIMGETGAN